VGSTRRVGADPAGRSAPAHATPSAIEPSGMGSQDGRCLAS
jgi:hypothetical protein